MQMQIMLGFHLIAAGLKTIDILRSAQPFFTLSRPAATPAYICGSPNNLFKLFYFFVN